MNTNLSLFYSLLMSVCCLSSYGQKAPQSIRPLSVGELCPDFLFSHMVRYPKPKQRLSGLKGKIVILDFWGTWCGSCVEAMPSMDRLQQKFKQDLLILPVTDENQASTQNSITDHKILDSLHLPSVTENKTLSRYFPHKMVPHEVWIDKTGRVMAITSDLDITEKNVESAIQTGKLEVAEKKDLFINYMKPFFAGYFNTTDTSGKFITFVPRADLIRYEGLVAGYIPGSPGLNVRRVLPNGYIKRTITNWQIAGLYRLAVQPHVLLTNYNGDNSENLPSRISLEVRDSSIQYWPHKSLAQWDAVPDSAKLFCYEQILPYKDSANMNGYMLRDLNNYFGVTLGISGFMAQRRVNCWVLENTGSFRVMPQSGETPSIEWGANEDSVKVTNEPLRIFMLQLLMYHLDNSPVPIINEVDPKTRVSFSIKANLLDPASIGKALEKYGMTFKLEQRDLEMLVIKDIR